MYVFIINTSSFMGFSVSMPVNDVIITAMISLETNGRFKEIWERITTGFYHPPMVQLSEAGNNNLILQTNIC